MRNEQPDAEASVEKEKQMKYRVNLFSRELQIEDKWVDFEAPSDQFAIEEAKKMAGFREVYRIDKDEEGKEQKVILSVRPPRVWP